MPFYLNIPFFFLFSKFQTLEDILNVMLDAPYIMLRAPVVGYAYQHLFKDAICFRLDTFLGMRGILEPGRCTYGSIPAPEVRAFVLR